MLAADLDKKEIRGGEPQTGACQNDFHLRGANRFAGGSRIDIDMRVSAAFGPADAVGAHRAAADQSLEGVDSGNVRKIDLVAAMRETSNRVERGSGRISLSRKDEDVIARAAIQDVCPAPP